MTRVTRISVVCFAAALSSACAKIESSGAQVDSRPAPADAAAAGVDVPGSPRPAAGNDAAPPPDVPMARPCVNLQCQQVSCPAGVTTTISGTAYAPNGKLPLYNVMVYVPNAPLDPFKAGVSCDRCGMASGRPIASAISNEQGKFKVTNAPVGNDIPLVLQVGKWRRKVTIPKVVACQDNPISDANLTRLPRNRMEGEMPKIAVTTGACDRLGCLLPKIGVAEAEMGTAADSKAITFYKPMTGGLPVNGVRTSEGPPNMTEAADLWRNEAELSKYDMVMLSCECREVLENKGAMAWNAMTRYLNKGGRMFGSDFMYTWYRHSPDPMLSGAMTIQGGARPAVAPITVDTTFPKGKALADWMKFVDPMVAYGEIVPHTVFDNITGSMRTTAQVWGSSPTDTTFDGRDAAMMPTPHPRIVTVNTPAGLPAEQQCGRAVYLDAHISTFAFVGGDFPQNCGGELNKGETALAFLFFDLAACIQNETAPVVPPIIVP